MMVGYLLFDLALVDAGTDSPFCDGNALQLCALLDLALLKVPVPAMPKRRSTGDKSTEPPAPSAEVNSALDERDL
jgi:hypothetical protein